MLPLAKLSRANGARGSLWWSHPWRSRVSMSISVRSQQSDAKDALFADYNPNIAFLFPGQKSVVSTTKMMKEVELLAEKANQEEADSTEEDSGKRDPPRITKILMPVDYHATVTDNVQRVSVSFRALR